MNLVSAINAELVRIGAADDYGQTGGLICWEEDGKVYVGDEAFKVVVTSVNLDILSTLPDDAGWEAAWEVLPGIE